MKITDRKDVRRAKVALARRMAVTIHRMWVDEQDFRWTAARQARPRNGERSMQGAVRASSHDLSLPASEHVEEL